MSELAPTALMEMVDGNDEFLFRLRHIHAVSLGKTEMCVCMCVQGPHKDSQSMGAL